MRLPEDLQQAVRKSFDQAQGVYSVLKTLAATGLGSLRPAAFEDARLSSPARAAYAALLMSDPKFMAARSAETAAIYDSLAQVQAAHITSLGNIPLIVLSRGQAINAGVGMAPDFEKQWR